MGVCFDLPDGHVIRLAISRESARQMAESLLYYLAAASGNAEGKLVNSGSINNHFDLDSALAEYLSIRGGAV